MSADPNAQINQSLATWLRPARATLIRLLGSIDAGSDASQEAALRALQQWQNEMPQNPRAWLVTVGYRFAIDQMRRRGREVVIDESLLPALALDEQRAHWRDDVLRLMFTCCHPALSEEVRIALTLHTILDWSYDDIAHALLLPIDTLAQRVLRGKRKITLANIPYEIPLPQNIDDRLDAVLRVIYLLFNAGYFTRNDETLLNRRICLDAIHLARELKQMLPQQAEVAGLYALLLLLHARADARMDQNGLPVLLPQQDRAKWDKRLIAEGISVLQKALQLKRNGAYQTQAAINALHAEANTAADTDWRQIIYLYDVLITFWPNPIVSLNQVVARLECGELDMAGKQLEQLQQPLKNYQAFYLTRAYWHHLQHDFAAQKSDLKQALAMSTQAAQQQWLSAQIPE